MERSAAALDRNVLVNSQACMAEAERERDGGPGDKPKTFSSRRTKYSIFVLWKTVGIKLHQTPLSSN